MKYIVKNEEPKEFIDWKNQEKSSLTKCYSIEADAADCAWRHLPSNKPLHFEEGIKYYSKKELKESLLSEQGFICAFCMERMQNDHLCTIDHLLPKKFDPPNRTFDYNNLLVCCSGIPDINSKLNYKEDFRHCNNKKGDQEISVTPFEEDCSSKFIFTIEGVIFPTSEVDTDARNTIKILGLDSKILERKRKQILENILYPHLPSAGMRENNRLIDKSDAVIIYHEMEEKKDGRFHVFCVAVQQVLENLFPDIILNIND